MDFGKIFSEFGLMGAVIGAMFFMFWRWSVWIMGWIKDKDKQTAEERIVWLSRLEKLDASISKTADNIDNHDKRADERGRYAKEEHKQMIEVLGRMNGYK